MVGGRGSKGERRRVKSPSSGSCRSPSVGVRAGDPPRPWTGVEAGVSDIMVPRSPHGVLKAHGEEGVADTGGGVKSSTLAHERILVAERGVGLRDGEALEPGAHLGCVGASMAGSSASRKATEARRRVCAKARHGERPRLGALLERREGVGEFPRRRRPEAGMTEPSLRRCTNFGSILRWSRTGSTTLCLSRRSSCRSAS